MDAHMIRAAVIHQVAGRRRVSPSIIEQDYCLSWLLLSLHEVDDLWKALIFKGGTALRKVYFPEWRYSEDLDFTATTPFSAERLHELVDAWLAVTRDASGLRVSLLENGIQATERQATLYVTYVGPLARVGTPRRIKADISFDERILLQPARREILKEYPDQAAQTGDLAVYQVEEILAEKLRSLLQRTEPRDLYDAWKIITDPPEPLDIGHILELAEQKCIHRHVRFDGPETLIDPRRLERFGRSWETRLAQQVPALPPFDEVVREFRRALRSKQP